MSLIYSARTVLLTLTALLAAAGSAFAQHESAGAIEEGGKIFRDFCANCHGPDGNLVAGIDLGRGQFRRNLSDRDLNEIIRKGIPNTPMPPTNFSEEQASRIVAYLRSIAASKTSAAGAGDPARGKAVFEGNGGCLACHAAGGRGARIGPDLSIIGSLRRANEIHQSIVDPPSEILPQNRMYRVVTSAGETVSGRLLNLDTFTVQLLDSSERLRSFEKPALKEHGFMETTMPSYKGKLAPQDLADLVSYLVSLRRTL
jgi:putative heme-binding domain-containing protein